MRRPADAGRRAASLGAFALSGSAAWVLSEHLASEPDAALDVSRQGAPFGPVPPRPLPPLSLPAMDGRSGFDTTAIAAGGRPVLLNVFASWCAPCSAEAPVLLRLHREGATIWGIAYRDRADAAAEFLNRLGDPYTRVRLDPAGEAGPVLGLSGVPETMLIDGDGAIVWHGSGALTETVAGTLLPRLRASG